MASLVSFEDAQKKHPKLMEELLALEYVLTWRYTDNYERDDKRHKEIQTIIYELPKDFFNNN